MCAIRGPRLLPQDGWPDIVYVDNANVGWYRNTGTPGAWFNSTPTIMYAGGPSKALIGLGALWILPIVNATAVAVGTWQGVMVLSTVPGTRQWTQPPVVVSNVSNTVLCLAAGDVNNDGSEVSTALGYRCARTNRVCICVHRCASVCVCVCHSHQCR